MGYNREDFVRIKAEFSEKYLEARKRAEDRRWELYERFPEIRRIDAELANTGASIMTVISSGSEDVASEIEKIKQKNVELLEQRAAVLLANGYPADYSDVHYECEKCGDTGYVNTKMCDCMRRALVMAGYESSGLAGLIRSQSFDNFSVEYYRDSAANYEKMKRVLSGLKNFAEGFSKDTYSNYILMGATGLGKTHLSTSVAKTVIENGYDVKYVSAMDLISDFEMQRFGNSISAREADDTADYYDCDLLIIDDLGTEMSNQFTVSCLYNIINVRINNAKATVISTNLSQNDLRQRYWDRITSRPFGEYRPLLFVGHDVRAQKLKKK